MSMKLNRQSANIFYSGEGENIDFRIDGTSMVYGDYINGKTVLNDNTFRATVMTETRNMTATMTAKFRGTGLAYNNTDNLPVWNLDGTSNYTLKMMPSVESISQATGYATGG